MSTLFYPPQGIFVPAYDFQEEEDSWSHGVYAAGGVVGYHEN